MISFSFAELRKSVAIISVSILALACGSDGKDTRCNTEIANYLYGVEYDDYDFDACKQYFDNQYIPAGAGCSEVRRGNFIGRNLDWYINRNASAVIKMNHSEDHYASIGVVGCFPQFSDDIAKSGKYDEVYKYLPFKTEDGINECGLYVGVNVMPTGETSFDTSSWKPRTYGLSAAHTNPSAEMTCAVNYLPRILLDRAGSVQEAMEIIDSINWTDPEDYPHKGETQSFHWLIGDPQRSVVLEFIDNKPHYTDATSITEPGYGTIMTNFTNCLREAGIMQINGIGYERYDILNENYGNYEEYPDNFQGMEKLISQVWFSKSYTIPADSKDFWLSEFACDSIPACTLYKHFDAVNDPILSKNIEADVTAFNDTSLWYKDDCGSWFSTHTSVYDLSAHKLHILVHEGLSGMDSFFEVSFDTSFAKPLGK